MDELELVDLGEVTSHTKGTPLGGFYENMGGQCVLSRRPNDEHGCGPAVW